ncbi:MAG: rhodanese-like domain-containing protein [Pseudomonadota bacterium]
MDSNILISPHALSNLISKGESVAILDTRDPEEFAKGHIPGAVNIRDFFTYLAMSDEEGYEAFRTHFVELMSAAGVDGDKQVVVYEEKLNNGFGQSCRGWLILQALGHTNAKVLDGGFHVWKSIGNPLTTEASEPTPSSFLVDKGAIDKVFVDKNEMLRAIDDHDIRILDIRDQDEWEGLSSSPYGIDFAPRKGRLSRSVWLQWDKLMEASARYLPSEYIVSTMRQLGIRPNDTIYIYCFKGARAANTYVALKSAGFENVKVYFGSWNEWSRDSELPIEPEVIHVAPSMV